MPELTPGIVRTVERVETAFRAEGLVRPPWARVAAAAFVVGTLDAHARPDRPPVHAIEKLLDLCHEHLD